MFRNLTIQLLFASLGFVLSLLIPGAVAQASWAGQGMDIPGLSGDGAGLQRTLDWASERGPTAVAGEVTGESDGGRGPDQEPASLPEMSPESDGPEEREGGERDAELEFDDEVAVFSPAFAALRLASVVLSGRPPNELILRRVLGRLERPPRGAHAPVSPVRGLLAASWSERAVPYW